MGLVNLSAVDPELRQWTDFWFNNWIDHQEIQQALQKKTGINFPVYLIDPWVESSSNAILKRHQFYHNDMNSIIGINGQDLSEINFEDQTAVQAWVYQHYQEHLAARQVLGLA
jgi:hypothetical protein